MISGGFGYYDLYSEVQSLSNWTRFLSFEANFVQKDSPLIQTDINWIQTLHK
jgi:hypothetical protein